MPHRSSRPLLKQQQHQQQRHHHRTSFRRMALTIMMITMVTMLFLALITIPYDWRSVVQRNGNVSLLISHSNHSNQSQNQVRDVVHNIHLDPNKTKESLHLTPMRGGQELRGLDTTGTVPYNTKNTSGREYNDDSQVVQMMGSKYNRRNATIIPVLILPISSGTMCPNDMYDDGVVHSQFLQQIPLPLLFINSSSLIPPTQHQHFHHASRFVWIHQAMSDRFGSVCYPDLVNQLFLRDHYFSNKNQNTDRNRTETSSIHVPSSSPSSSGHKRQRLDSFRNDGGSSNSNRIHKIHILDWLDNPSTLPRCPNMEQLAISQGGRGEQGETKTRRRNNATPNAIVQYWKRSIVRGRYWDNETQSIVLGTVMKRLNGVPVKFLAYAVRSDVVDELNRLVLTTHPQPWSLLRYHDPNDNYTNLHESKLLPQQVDVMSSVNTTTHTSILTDVWNASFLTEYLVTKDRFGDVVHHWPISGSKGGISRGSQVHSNSVFRTLTSQILLSELTQPPYNITEVLCDVRGAAGRRGRAGVSSGYVESMLQYKIVVVVQRDDWEGHFRLFEAMISGALVIHDRMLAMPLGLEENVNIVFFDNVDDLKDKIVYYLQHQEERLDVARRGRQLAMCHHRSWHRLEQIIFGKTMTPCDE